MTTPLYTRDILRLAASIPFLEPIDAPDGEAERQPDGQRGRNADTECQVDEQAQRQPAQHDLGEAESENVPAQSPQPARVELEPYDEQEQGDADFGDARQVLGIVEQAEQMRADDRPADEIAERRAEPELAEQSDRDQRRAKHHRRAFEQGAGRVGGFGGVDHRASSIAASRVTNGSRMAA